MRPLCGSRISGQRCISPEPAQLVPETHRKEVSMWGKKNTDEMSPLDATAEHETGWLGSSLQVKGEITGTEDLQNDGADEGRIHRGEGKMTVGTTGKITADKQPGDGM